MSDIFARDRASIVAKLQEQLDHHDAAVVQARTLKNNPMIRYHGAEATLLRAKIGELSKMDEAQTEAAHDNAG